MAEIKLEVSIYPTVWCVVLKDSGLPVGEVTDSIWATKFLAEAAAYRRNSEPDTKMEWEAVSAPVGNEIT